MIPLVREICSQSFRREKKIHFQIPMAVINPTVAATTARVITSTFLDPLPPANLHKKIGCVNSRKKKTL
jgi:hypothetical protein